MKTLFLIFFLTATVSFSQSVESYPGLKLPYQTSETLYSDFDIPSTFVKIDAQTMTSLTGNHMDGTVDFVVGKIELDAGKFLVLTYSYGLDFNFSGYALTAINGGIDPLTSKASSVYFMSANLKSTAKGIEGVQFSVAIKQDADGQYKEEIEASFIFDKQGNLTRSKSVVKNTVRY